MLIKGLYVDVNVSGSACLGLWLVPADLSNHIEEIRGTSKGSAFLFHMGSQVVGKDFNHCLRCKFVHGVLTWLVTKQGIRAFCDFVLRAVSGS